MLDHFHMTENRFIDYIQVDASNNLLYDSSTANCMMFKTSGPSHDFSLLKFDFMEGRYCFPI